MQPKYEIGDLIKLRTALSTSPTQNFPALVLGHRISTAGVFPNAVYKLMYLDPKNITMERTQDWIDREYEYA
jgi:hypothetical protein